MKGGRARRRPLASALSHSGFVCMGPVERGLVGEERARVLSLKSKSLCASHPPPGCGPRKSSYEGAVSVEGGGKGEIIRTFCRSLWRHCRCTEEIACNGAYSFVTDGIRCLQQEMTEKELAILGSISKVPINNRNHSCGTFPASS